MENTILNMVKSDFGLLVSDEETVEPLDYGIVRSIGYNIAVCADICDRINPSIMMIDPATTTPLDLESFIAGSPTDKRAIVSAIIAYVSLQVRLELDSPSPSMLDHFNRLRDQCEWRLGQWTNSSITELEA